MKSKTLSKFFIEQHTTRAGKTTFLLNSKPFFTIFLSIGKFSEK